MGLVRSKEVRDGLTRPPGKSVFRHQVAHKAAGFPLVWFGGPPDLPGCEVEDLFSEGIFWKGETANRRRGRRGVYHLRPEADQTQSTTGQQHSPRLVSVPTIFSCMFVNPIYTGTGTTAV